MMGRDAGHAGVAGDVEAADPRLLLDADGLVALAQPGVVQRGLQYAKDHRVKELGLGEEGGELWAVVEDELGPDWRVEVVITDDGALEATCECRDEEGERPEAGAREGLCRHAVAALATYAERQAPGLDEFADDAARAVAERRQRGRTTVRAKHVAGEPAFGEWSARSVDPSGASLRPYKVVIRSTTEHINFCSCPDFATNLLGTCKHIEGVLYRIEKDRRKRGGRAGSGAQGAPRMPIIYVDWDAPGGPKIRLRRAPGTDPEVAAVLDHHFDARGYLKRPSMNGLYGALQDLEFDPADVGSFDRGGDLYVGEEAMAFAQRELEDVARSARTGQIREELSRSGGHLRGINAKLSPYQVEGVSFLAGKGRALLADDMGLGKTLQAIVAAHLLMKHSGVRRALVVCPASLKHEWAAEIERFTRLDCQVIEGRKPRRLAQYRALAAVSIVNYELVLKDREEINQTLRPDLLILDEAQRIKNWKTKSATAVKAIRTPYAFVLSGTPLENRLEDLYSVMQVVDPYVLGPLWLFMKKYHVLDERGRPVANRNLAELRERLRPVMLRRTRRVVLDQLPPITYKRHEVELDTHQRALHAGALQAARQLARIRTTRPLTPTEQHRLMAALQRARMACDAAGLADPERFDESSPKLDELRTLLQELVVEGGEKVVIFSQWERMTRMVQRVVEDLGLGFERLHGGVPTSKRRALFQRFREDPECRVFITTDAGKEGLNLQHATVVINMELPYNPATLDQRIGRVHRRGQTRSVLAIQLIAANSYESHVASLVQTKRGVFEGVFDDERGVDVVGLTDKALSAALEALDKTLAQTPKAGPEGEVGASNGDDPEAEEVLEEGAEEGLEAAFEEASEDGAEEASEEASEEVVASPLVPLRDDEAGYDLGPLLEKIQAVLGAHLDRVLAVSGGLVCITNQAPSSALDALDALDAAVPVAVVERDTWAGLSEVLGGRGTGVFGDAGAEVVLEPLSREPTTPPLVALARERLGKAERLRREDGAATARLAAESMAAALAHAAGQEDAPESSGLAVWLYGELVPRGVATAETASAVLRAHGLAQASAVPEDLVSQVLADAHRVLHETGAAVAL